jgi:hypothetical protein
MRTKKVKVVETPMQTGRRLIDDLVKFLNHPTLPYDMTNSVYAAREHVWNVLTALRGPDSDNYNVKCVTTSRLRGALGLSGEDLAIVHYGTPAEKAEDVNYHFNIHYERALEALKALGYLK